MRFVVSLLLLFSSAASAAVEPGVFLDPDTVVLADGIFKQQFEPATQDIETASNLMRWLDRTDGAPTSGQAFKGVLFNVTFGNNELKIDPIDPDAAQAALGPCTVANMNGVSDPKNRTDRRFIAFLLDCSDKSAVVTMTLKGKALTAAYVHNDNFVPVVMK